MAGFSTRRARPHRNGACTSSRSRGASMRIGDRVFWEDCDPDGIRGNGTVVSLEYEPVDDGTLIGIDMDEGGFVMAFRHDLREEIVSPSRAAAVPHTPQVRPDLRAAV